MEIIESLHEITKPWLSAALGIDPSLICTFTVDDLGDLPISQAAIVNIHYASEEKALPASLFIKVTNENTRKTLEGYGEREVRFYNEVGCQIGPDHIPNRYFAVYNKEINVYNILLEDFSKSHFQTEYPVPPTIDYCKMAVECLAKIHSFWWDHADLEKVTNPFETREGISGYVRYLREISDRFSIFMADRLDGKRRKILERVLCHLEELYERYLTYKNLTLTHGDAHYWNFLLPKNREDKIKLIDWQSYESGVGANDLAYMLALHWFPGRRREYEDELLKYYHKLLLENGVTHYSFADLVYDYKWSVIQLLFIPAFQWDIKLWAGIWFNHLERIFGAYEDLNCDELIS